MDENLKEEYGEIVSLDQLTENSVSTLRVKNGVNWRRAYSNSIRGRERLIKEVEEPHLSKILSVWGDKQTVEERDTETFDLPVSITVQANILVSSMYEFNLEIDGWKVIPGSGGTKFVKKFKFNATDEIYNGILDSINNLQYILLACFIDDFVPRVINYFQVDKNIPSVLHTSLATILGLSILNDHFSPIENPIRYMDIPSKETFGLFNDKDTRKLNIERIKEWYMIFNNHPGLAINVHLIMQSLVIFGKYYTYRSFFDFSDLLNGIILLVSGLEGIFLKKQNDLSDLSFKFSLIGSIYYVKYADENLIKGYKIFNKYKYSFQDFREILKQLYSIRSLIAHGNYEKLHNKKTWSKLLTILENQFYGDKDNLVYIFRRVSFSLGVFIGKHILALIIGAKENLLKGASIINEVEFNTLKEK